MVKLIFLIILLKEKKNIKFPLKIQDSGLQRDGDFFFFD